MKYEPNWAKKRENIKVNIITIESLQNRALIKQKSNLNTMCYSYILRSINNYCNASLLVPVCVKRKLNEYTFVMNLSSIIILKCFEITNADQVSFFTDIKSST